MSAPLQSAATGVALLAIFSVGLPGYAVAGDTTLPLPGGPEAAVASFERFGCSTCHTVGAGIAARGGGPDLGRINLRLGFSDGAARLWNHAPGMYERMQELHISMPEQFTGSDLLNLVAFFTAYQYYLTRVGRPGRPERGEILFRDKSCDQCHALKHGLKSKGPNLHRYGGGRSVLELAQAMWNHGPQMQAMLERQLLPRPYFRKREMADVLAYLATQGTPRGLASAYIEPGDPSRGATVFSEHGCARCHAVRGVGGAAARASGEKPPPDLGRDDRVAVRDYTDIAALMWNHAVPMWGRMRRQGIAVQPLENTELADLVAYLFFVSFAEEPGDQERGAAVFKRRGCLNCHPIDAPPGTQPNTRLLPAKVGESNWDVLASMWRHVPEMHGMADRRKAEWPKVEGGEMRHLASYVQKMRSEGQFIITIPLHERGDSSENSEDPTHP